MFCILLPFLKQNWRKLVHEKHAESKGRGIFHRGFALEVKSDSGTGLGRFMLINLHGLESSGWRQLGTYPFLVLTGLSFTLPDLEYTWTTTPVTLSLPFSNTLASASGYVSVCSPCPSLPVLYRPPVNRNNSLFWSHNPPCNEGLHSILTW